MKLNGQKVMSPSISVNEKDYDGITIMGKKVFSFNLKKDEISKQILQDSKDRSSQALGLL